jgi:hypothetical protein
VGDTVSYRWQEKKLRDAETDVPVEIQLRAAHERRMSRLSPEDRITLRGAAEIALERAIRKAKQCTTNANKPS